MRAGSSISHTHFGDRAEEGAIVHLLKRAAPAHGALDLADEQDQRRGIVLGDVDAVRGVGRARPARDEGDAGPAGEARRRFRHHRRAGLLPAHRHLRSTRHAARRARRDRFAGHAEHVLHALGGELVDEDLSAGAEVGSVMARSSMRREFIERGRCHPGGSVAKQTVHPRTSGWIASLRSQ